MKYVFLTTLLFFGILLLVGPTIMDRVRDSNDLPLSDGSRAIFIVGGALMVIGAIVGGLLGTRHHPRLKM